MATATTARTATGTKVRVFRGGHYNVRDQLGHYVKPVSAEEKPCPHACCRNRRVHPENLPVRLDRAYLRSLDSDELDRELSSYAGYADTHEAGFLQVVAELNRRDESAKRAGARKERARDRRQRAQSEFEDEVYRQWLHAEAETRGVMLNKAGIRAGINERSLFTGPRARVTKYASPELLEWFAQHGRPTREAFMRGGQSRDIYF